MYKTNMDEDLRQGIGRCGACDSTGSSLLKCSGCRLVSYCGTECQARHWKEHKSTCKEKRRAIQEVMLFEQQEGNHFGECPICFLPMPFDADKIMTAAAEDEEHYNYLKEITATSCCSTTVCTNCFDAHIITCCKERIKPTCPFCRSETPDAEKNDYELLDVAGIDNHQTLIKNGAILCGRGDHAAAFTCYKKAAKLGNVQGMYFLSTMLHCGIGVATNHGKADAYVMKAAAGGHPIARHEAGMYELCQGNAERAVRHFCIAASQGVTKSLEELKSGYKSGYVTKTAYEEAIRANHKAKVDKSEHEKTRSQMLAGTRRR